VSVYAIQQSVSAENVHPAFFDDEKLGCRVSFAKDDFAGLV
jgi:hypothetical protein